MLEVLGTVIVLLGVFIVVAPFVNAALKDHNEDKYND